MTDSEALKKKVGILAARLTARLASGEHSVAVVSALFGIHRSTLYKSTKQQILTEINEQTVLNLVHDIRSRHPRMGARKLPFMLQHTLLGIRS